MPGLIPQETLDDILSRVNIVELISSSIPLKRAGRNFKAACPFHHEKTASFMVSPERQIYHCFGCNAGGNAFNFLMQYERLDFIEAVRVLAKKAGVTLPEFHKQDQQIVSLGTQIYKINELSSGFYANTLYLSEGTNAKSYLLKRGLKEETLKLFKIGFVSDKRDNLMNHLRAKGISLSLIEKAGLILTREGGGYYDRFRNRIIFPIFDIKSRILGFGARVLDNSLPKYINSPETPIYVKGKNLYGLNFAKDAIIENDFVVIVEGYLDFIMPFQEGLQNIVASLGTALTLEQARLLKRYTHNVVMIYDPDAAGELATLRNLDIFVEEEMNVKIVTLPKGTDPDSFVSKNGVERLKEKIKSAENLFDYKIKVLKSRHNTVTIEGKALVCAEMLLTIAKFKNAVLKSEYLKKLAQELNIEEDAILQELKKIKVDKQYTNEKAPVEKNIIFTSPTEKLLIKLMLEEAELIERIRHNLEPSDFQDKRMSQIVSIIFNLLAQGKDVKPSTLINYIEEKDALSIICESTFLPELSLHNKEKIADDCIQRLKKERVKFKREHLHEQIKNAQSLGDNEKLDKLMQEFHQLVKIQTKN